MRTIAAAPVSGRLAAGLSRLGLHPELWAGLAPNGLGQQKPHHYRDMLRIARQQSVDECAAGLSRRGMCYHASRLVDHQQVTVLIQDL